jgi:hypothetical protein
MQEAVGDGKRWDIRGTPAVGEFGKSLRHGIHIDGVLLELMQALLLPNTRLEVLKKAQLSPAERID